MGVRPQTCPKRTFRAARRRAATFVVIAAVVFLLAVLVVFPVVGLALLPVIALGILVLAAWTFAVARRAPSALPVRTTSPDEPNDLGT